MKLTINSLELYMDAALVSNLDIFRDMLRNDYDVFLILSGDEGTGKSTFAKQICSYISDGKFNVNDIAFTHKQFKDCILKAERYSAILFDEAVAGLSARQSMTSINKSLISMTAQCRKRNLFVVVCLPSYFDLDRNIALHRSRGLIQVYTNKIQRGFFSYFTKEQKKMLWITGRPTYNNLAVKPEFRGRFTKWSLIDEEEYEKRKDEAFIDNTSSLEKTSKHLAQRNALFYILSSEFNQTHERIKLLLEKYTGNHIDRSTISEAISNFKKDIPLESELLVNVGGENLSNTLKFQKQK